IRHSAPKCGSATADAHSDGPAHSTSAPTRYDWRRTRKTPPSRTPMIHPLAGTGLNLARPSTPKEFVMPLAVTTDPILKRFRAALDELYGDRIERVVLYGSRARGDAGPESDYDVAVLLKDLKDRWPEMNRLADLSTDIIEQTGEFIHAMAYRAGAYNDERTPLMREIRQDGIDL